MYHSDAIIQFLKPSMLGHILVHHKHVLTSSSSFLNEANNASMTGEVTWYGAVAKDRDLDNNEIETRAKFLTGFPLFYNNRNWPGRPVGPTSGLY